MAAVIAAIDANGAGSIEICSAAYAAVLCTIALSLPSFTESGGVLTMQGTPKSGTATGAGTAALARIKDGLGAVIVSALTVGSSGAEINLASTSIAVDQTVTLTSGTITHSP
jgi:hypothetical protein